MRRGALFLALLLAVSMAPDSLAAETSPPPGAELVQALTPLLGQPFRSDGAQDEEGRWVTFNQPDQVSAAPGFNCSGFTVAVARRLLNYPFSLSEAAHDRRGDSGPGSPLGQDWDFGLDLILNLAEGRILRTLPETDLESRPFETLGSGRALGWGTDLHGQDFEDLAARIQPGNFAFFCFSRPDRRFAAGVSYYHVGLIVPEPPHIWLYHSTLGRASHRVDLAAPEQLARLRRHFPPPAWGERRVFMVEVLGAIAP